MEKIIKLENGQAKAYTIDAGGFNIIVATTGKGLVGCGAFDVAALEKFEYPAVIVKGPISTVADLLAANVVRSNLFARQIGIDSQMTGLQALEAMS